MESHPTCEPVLGSGVSDVETAATGQEFARRGEFALDCTHRQPVCGCRDFFQIPSADADLDRSSYGHPSRVVMIARLVSS